MGYCVKCNTHFPNIQYHYCGGEQMRRWQPRERCPNCQELTPDLDNHVKICRREFQGWGPPTYSAEYIPPPPPQTVLYVEPAKELKQEPFDPAKSDARLDILLFTILGFIVVGSIYLTALIIPEVL